METNMLLNEDQWIPLLTFSTKYNISLSTLRRRIRENSIECKFVGGKYLLKDTPPVNKRRVQKALPSEESLVAAPGAMSLEVLEEIKAIYERLIREKDQRIAQLNEEVLDLKMLVRILESQNEQKLEPKPVTEVKEKFFVPTLPEDFYFDEPKK